MNTNFRRLDSLEGQVAVIAGGLGYVGFASAIRLAEKKARVVLLVRRNLDEAQTKLSELPYNNELQHKAVLASVTDSASLEKASEFVQLNCGRCDILVNAAGISQNIKPNNLEELTDEIFDDIVKTNLRGVFATIRSFSKLLKASGNGLIVNISSTSSLKQSQRNVAYAAAKAGVNLMTMTLAKALAPEIRVVTVSPGPLSNAISGVTRVPGFDETQGALAALKRVGEADDIASAVEAYATTLRFTTGINLVVDGGRIL